MQLIKKWHPEDSPLIPNWVGPAVYRMVALMKDGVADYYSCFFDMKTGKIYVEKIIRAKFSGDFGTQDLWQIQDDQEWVDAMQDLKNYEVIDTIETKIHAGMTDMELNKELLKLPRCKEGCDAKGNPLPADLTLEMATSPSDSAPAQ